MADQEPGPSHGAKSQPVPWRFQKLHWNAVSNSGPTELLDQKSTNRDISVAWAQMYLILGTLFRPNKSYQLELGESDESDVYPVVDNEFGVAKYGSRGLNAVVN